MTGDLPIAPLSVLIVDDEPLAVERLELICARLPGITLLGSASDGEAALQRVEQLRPDLLLLDIQMPGMDGMALARKLAQYDCSPGIIFVTAFDSFAVEAFDLAAADYVLKPVETERLARAIARVRERGKARPAAVAAVSPYAQEFWVPYRSELRRIATASIERIEAERDYMRLHIGTTSYLLHQTITALEERLDPDMFIRLHRSHLVRRDHIAGLRHDGGGVWLAALKCGTEIRIGRTHLPAVKRLAGK
jgi:two-component system response regulator AlgR